MRKLIVTILIIIFFTGILWSLVPKMGLGRLPGDISFKKWGGVVYLPITTSIVISAVISLIIWIAKKI